MADLLLNIIGSDGASAAFRGVAASFEELSKLAMDCTKAFEEQAKADRQLERYAKDLTGAFKEQASQMQEHLGVSDDMVESMQTMLLRFGEAPDQVEATTRALLDYSAATGEDALGATRTLLSSVESGKTAFKDLGLTYEKTGKASADLQSITEALAGKLGGSAAAEADSVAGQAKKAAAMVDEFKESVGGLISDFINKTGAIGTFTEAIKTLQLALFGASESSLTGIQQNLDAAKASLADMTSGWADAKTLLSAGALGPTKEDIDAQIAEVKRLEAAWAALDAKQRAAGGRPVLPGLAGADRSTKQGKAAADKAMEEEKAAREANIKLNSEEEQRDMDMRKRNLDAVQKANDDLLEEAKKADQKEAERVEKKMKDWEANRAEEADAYIRTMTQKEKEAAREMKKIQDATDKQNKEFEKTMEEAGTAIALAFIHSLANVLSEAMSGDEVDPLEQFGEIAAGILEIAGIAIGTYFGAPTIGGALGGLAGGLVKDATKKKTPAKGYGKKHDGGWVGEYHSGGWPGASSDEEMAILQRGERVLSRSEVGRMGGQAGVDGAARGGGGRGMTINVSTMDSSSFREYLGDRGGRGFYNALRTGQGMLTPIFGR